MDFPEATDIDYSYTIDRGASVAGLSLEQQQIVNALSEGWLLFQNKNSHNWYMKRTDIPPFRSSVGTLYKPAVQALLNKRVIKPTSKCSSSGDVMHILRIEGSV